MRALVARAAAPLRRLLSYVVAQVDLRFSDPAEEAAFKASLEPELLQAFVIMQLFIMFNSAATLVEFEHAENLAAGMDWGSLNCRTLPLLLRLFTLAIFAVLLVPTILRWRCGFLKHWNWEAIVTCSMLLYMLSFIFIGKWYTAVMFGVKPTDVWEEGTEDEGVVTVLCVIAVIVALSLGVPIRFTVLWVAPVVASLLVITVRCSLGSPFPHNTRRVIAILHFVLVMSSKGAQWHELHLRERWRAKQVVREQDRELEGRTRVAGALSTVAGTLLDVVVMLDSEKRIVGSDDRHVAFFGQYVEEQALSELLTEADRPRFDALISQATQQRALQSMPASFLLDFARLEAQLVVVDAGGESPRYVVGLHSVVHKDTPDQHQIRSDDVAAAVADAIPELDEDRVSVPASRLESLATTTMTGHVFEDIRRANLVNQVSQEQLRSQLERIAKIGCEEHWLVGTAEVRLFPSYVLGSGGFGVVTLATLRGTALAAKLPKVQNSTRSIRFLASAMNELRVCRHVRHPNIVAFFGACLDPGSGSLALLYELVRGIGLDKYVLGLPRRQDLARAKVLLDIASALCYIHALTPPIVHSDIKPANIMVEELRQGPRAKLLDFGLSRLLTKQVLSLGGTRSWMAPEQTRLNAPRPAPSADVFSFGLLMQFVVLGTRDGDRRWPGDDGCLGCCRELSTACLKQCPSDRPSMRQVQDTLVLEPDCDVESLTTLGLGVVALALPGKSWSEGIAELQDTPQTRLRHQVQQRASPVVMQL